MIHPARSAALAIPRLKRGHFHRATPQDLRALFEIYDAHDFEGGLTRALAGRPLRFRWSTRMTSTGGKTTIFRSPHGHRFEIAISSLLLNNTFSGEARAITVCGVQCEDRLDALLRVFEHELVHLHEMLEFDESNCKAARFKRIVRDKFGHTESTHRLVTPRERAARGGVRAGTRVRFEFEGRHLEGFVNRITKRATVLVEDPRGQPYSDGKTYSKYYVPLSLLTSARPGRS